METQKIVKLLNSSENKYSKFARKKWHVIESEAKAGYSRENPIKFLTSLIELGLCDYTLATENIAVTRAMATANVGA